MRRVFHDHLKKDIKVTEDIGVMLPSSADDREFEGLTFEEMAEGQMHTAYGMKGTSDC